MDDIFEIIIVMAIVIFLGIVAITVVIIAIPIVLIWGPIAILITIFSYIKHKLKIRKSNLNTKGE